MEWKTVALTVLVVSLLFFVVPIRVGPDGSVEEENLFRTYIAKYNRSYENDPAEYNKRFEYFKKSLRHIERMNSLRSSPESAYYGLTKYSDLSENEFIQDTLQPDLSIRGEKHKNGTYRIHHHRESNNRVKRATDIPTKVDWRTKGVIAPVRSQGSCGACWAFSTVEVAESMLAIKNNNLQLLSVQEMIDCARNSNFGCEGGDICSLLTWLTAQKVSILSEDNYPLTRKTDVCKLQKIKAKTPGVLITDFTCDNFVDTENDLLITLANHGPVAAAVNALSWQNYLGGIVQFHCDGSFSNLNHAVQIVGYDKTATIPHYIIKNSWGPTFGDKGYIYIAIGNNLCGIANQVSSVDVI